MSAIQADAAVPAPREEVFAFLVRLENHWQLADRWITVVQLDSDGGEGAGAGEGEVNGGAVRVRGPLGLSRLVRTRVVGIEPPERIRGLADTGRRTRAEVTWSLAASGEVTWVTLEAEIEGIGPLDAILWRLGGRRWMRRRFEAVLGGLARRFAGRA